MNEILIRQKNLVKNFALKIAGKVYNCSYSQDEQAGVTVAWYKGNLIKWVDSQTELKTIVKCNQGIKMNPVTKKLEVVSPADVWDGKYGYQLARLRLEKLIADALYNYRHKNMIDITRDVVELSNKKYRLASKIKDLHNKKYPNG